MLELKLQLVELREVKKLNSQQEWSSRKTEKRLPERTGTRNLEPFLRHVTHFIWEYIRSSMWHGYSL